MDGDRGICRRYYWWLCLLCLAVFVNSADAATRRYPAMPTSQQVGTGGTAVGKGTATYSIEQPGVDYIPSDYASSKGTKLPVKVTYDYSIPRTFSHAKNWIGKIGKGGAIGIGTSIAIDMMLDEIDAVMDQGQLKRPKPSDVPATGTYWCYQPTNTSSCSRTATQYNYLASDTPQPIMEMFQAQTFGSTITFDITSIQHITSKAIQVNYSYKSRPADPPSTMYIRLYMHGECPSNSVYSQTAYRCQVTQLMPLDESDSVLMEAFVNAQNSAWLQGLLKDVCAASTNPGGCFAELKEQGSKLSGPDQVSGPSKTTTASFTDANGVSQQTTTTQNTTYNITYGSNYYDYRKTVTTTKTGTDGTSETSTEAETPDVTEEEKPPQEEQEEEQVAAVPCSGSSCDGPSYEDQYQPVEETKEDHIDSYVDRVASIPIIQAVGNLFDISAGGSCPVWTFNHQLEIGGFSTNINLVFDYLCQPWFTQYGPWIRAVIYLVAVYAAIRVALL